MILREYFTKDNEANAILVAEKRNKEAKKKKDEVRNIESDDEESEEERDEGRCFNRFYLN